MQRPTSGKPFSFDFNLLQTACISLLSTQVPLLAATLLLGLHAPAASAQGQSAEAIRKIAKAITVRIEGAMQGSGVIVKREGKRYTVLTAWHVVSGQKPREELKVVTHDKKEHQTSLKDIEIADHDIDLATLEFSSETTYQVARLNMDELTDLRGIGSNHVTSGYPLDNQNKLKFVTAEISGVIKEPRNGYAFKYISATDIGMSGGPVISGDGNLIAIHGRGTYDEERSLAFGNTIKSPTSLGIPLLFACYGFTNKFICNKTNDVKNTSNRFISKGVEIVEAHPNAPQFSGYASKIWRDSIRNYGILLRTKGIKVFGDILLAYAYWQAGDHRQAESHLLNVSTEIPTQNNYYNALANEVKCLLMAPSPSRIDCLKKLLQLYPDSTLANINLPINYIWNKRYKEAESAAFDCINNRAVKNVQMCVVALRAVYMEQEEKRIDKWIQALTIAKSRGDGDVAPYNVLGGIRIQQGKYDEAIELFSEAISLDPWGAEQYENRGNAYFLVGQNTRGCNDYLKALKLGGRNAIGFLRSEQGVKCLR